MYSDRTCQCVRPGGPIRHSCHTSVPGPFSGR
ncbi:hypothetical protein D0N87_06415 [Pseudomonas sp. ATCC 13867]|nr:hypothetical protein D0N87_06415 [Pseudomonas sp. ATCC 13867]